MRRREFIKALGATVAGWAFGAGAQTQPDQLRVEAASPNAQGQPPTLTKSQSDALNTYNNAVNDFKSILAQRSVQINSNQGLPNLPGQALYLARINMMSAYKDLTEALPSKIGRPNKFGIPPAYFDADGEPLIDEYRKLFDIMEAPPVNAQNSDTPFKDVVDLGIAIGRAKGLGPSAKFLMRCGSSITNLNERFPNSTRSGFADKGKIRSQPIPDHRL